MGLGGVAIAVLPSMIYPKQPFSDGLGGSGGEECLLTLHHSSPLFTLCAGFKTYCCLGLNCLRSNHSCRTLASFSAHHRSDAYRQSWHKQVCNHCPHR